MTDDPSNGQQKRLWKRPTLLQGLLGLAGVIFTGALGSAFWDVVLKPSFSYFLVSIVKLSFFGIANVEENIYRDIAAGSYERSSLQLLIIVSTAIAAGPFGYFTGSARTFRKWTRSPDEIFSKQDLFTKIQRNLNYSYKMAFAFGVVTFFMIFLVATIIYEVKAEAYIRQMMRIDRPYMDENSYNKINSEAALIKNQKDYSDLVNKLKSIAKDNNILPPEFQILR